MSTRHTGSILLTAAVVLSGCSDLSDGGTSGDKKAIPLSRDQIVHEVEMIVVPSGTVIQIRLDQELSTTSNEVGDPFTGTVMAPIVIRGKTAIPATSRVHGRITAVERTKQSSGAAILKLDFTDVEIGGKTHPLEVSMVEANPEIRSRTSTGEAAAKIGAATAGGAILGRILGGDGKSSALGAIAGAAAGTAIVLGTRDADAVLPAGSIVKLRTAEPLHLHLPS